MKRRILLIIFFSAIMAVIGIILIPKAAKETPAIQEQLIFPELSDKGGYTMETEEMFFTLEADGASQYAHYRAKNGSTELTLYVAPTQLLLIENTNGVCRYYSEPVTDSQAPENPLAQIFEQWRELEFSIYKTSESGTEYYAQQSYQVEKQNSVAYTSYLLSMTWTDGKDYTFQYFEYQDGGILISVDAPDEMNPYFTKDCKWVIDIETMELKNSETLVTIPLQLISTETGTSVSILENSEKAYETKTEDIYILTNNNGDICGFRHISDSITVSAEIIPEFTIQCPEILEGWEIMDAQSAQSGIFLICALMGIF